MERELNEIRKHMDNVLLLMSDVIGDAEMTETEEGEIELDDYSEEKVDMLQGLLEYLYGKQKEVECKLEEKEISRRKKQDLYAQLGELGFVNEAELLELIENEKERQ